MAELVLGVVGIAMAKYSVSERQAIKAISDELANQPILAGSVSRLADCRKYEIPNPIPSVTMAVHPSHVVIMTGAEKIKKAKKKYLLKDLCVVDSYVTGDDDTWTKAGQTPQICMANLLDPSPDYFARSGKTIEGVDDTTTSGLVLGSVLNRESIGSYAGLGFHSSAFSTFVRAFWAAQAALLEEAPSVVAGYTRMARNYVIASMMMASRCPGAACPSKTSPAITTRENDAGDLMLDFSIYYTRMGNDLTIGCRPVAADQGDSCFPSTRNVAELPYLKFVNFFEENADVDSAGLMEEVLLGGIELKPASANLERVTWFNTSEHVFSGAIQVSSEVRMMDPAGELQVICDDAETSPPKGSFFRGAIEFWVTQGRNGTKHATVDPRKVVLEHEGLNDFYVFLHNVGYYLDTNVIPGTDREKMQYLVTALRVKHSALVDVPRGVQVQDGAVKITWPRGSVDLAVPVSPYNLGGWGYDDKKKKKMKKQKKKK